MAVWIKRTEKQIRIRHLNVTLWTLALGLAMAAMVPVAFEWTLTPPNWQARRENVYVALALLTTAFTFAPWTSLTVDAVRREIRYRCRRSFWVQSSSARCDAVRGVERVGRSWLGVVARNRVRVQFDAGVIDLPYGLSGAAPALDRAEALARELERVARTPADQEIEIETLSATPRPRWQASLRRLLIATTLAAAVLGLIQNRHWASPDSQVAAPVALAMMLVGGIMLFRRGYESTERMCVTLAAMYAPFAWIVLYSRPFGRTTGLWENAVLFPSAWPIFAVAIVNGQHPQVAPWWLVLSLVVQLSLGVWFAFRGWRWTLPLVALIGLIISASSFLYHVLFRA